MRVELAFAAWRDSGFDFLGFERLAKLITVIPFIAPTQPIALPPETEGITTQSKWES
jgi:hypothetical protein